MLLRLSMLRITIVFLVLLRLAIGWHFFFEGYHKIHSTDVGQTETNRPFSSEGFFRGAPGPLGPFVRAQIGSDPDEQALARLTVKPIPAPPDPTKVPPPGTAKVSLNERIPDELAKDIDDYTKRFLDAYPLSDAQKTQAEVKAKEAKEKITLFLLTSVDAGQHISEYRAKLAEYRDAQNHKLPTLGREQENARLTSIRTEANKARKESLDDLDKELGKVLRDEFNKIVKEKLAKVDLKSVPAGADPFPYLLPLSDGKALPADLDKRWNEYYEVFKATYPLTETQTKRAEERLRTVQEMTAVWLVGKQAIPPTVAFGQGFSLDSMNPLLACSAAIAARDGLSGDAIEQNELVKSYLNAALTDEQLKGAPPTVKPEPTPFLYRLDQLTRWGLTIMGACLLLGLLTRTNCVVAAGFLVGTYFTWSPWPWLTVPPNNEGFYLFVNKNLVELLALLVLATTASGRWFGLDALLHRLFSREEPAKKPARPAARAA